jgi:hypothetical protein
MAADGWSVEVSALAVTSSLVKKMEGMGGYAITHVGSIKRQDGSSFTPKQAEDMVGAVQHFFSFARGAWSSPILAVGVDDQGVVVWRDLSDRILHRWGFVWSWFGHMSGELLPQTFPGFMSLCKRELWHAPMQEIIHLYLESNSQSLMDVGIVLAQTALETLSWIYCVKERKFISGEGFKDLRASDKLRMLMASLCLPLEIPKALDRVNSLAAKYHWQDGAHAFTELRNEFIHPEHKHKGQFNEAIYEGWEMGQWYIELALLRMFGHNGNYCNRLTQKLASDVERVPWAEQGTAQKGKT